MATHTSGALRALKQPLPNAVIQRTGDRADVTILLEATERGKLYARLRKGRKPLTGLRWRKVGTSDGETASGRLEGVPVGGEYTLDIELRAARGAVIGRASVGGLLVGDLWVTGGQSNMDGWGKLAGVEPPSRMVHAFYFDDRWDAAEDPLCWYSEAVDRVHWPVAEDQLAESARNDRRFRQAGAGPAVSFGKTLYRETGIPIGLIVCSHGGTSMDQWSPAKANEGGASLYGSMIRRVKAVGGRVAGMIWYQGESDANKDAQPVYRAKMLDFVNAVRRDFHAPALPFLYVQIGCFYAGEEVAELWNRLQADELALESALAPAAMASAIDLGLADLIHIATGPQRRLGRRLAYLAGMLTYGKEGRHRGPRMKEVFADTTRPNVLGVRFSGVNGGLHPKRGIRGFSVKKGGRNIAVLRADVAPQRADTVLLRLEEPVEKGMTVAYGQGINPTVNLVDEADLAAPVSPHIKL